MGFWGFGVLGFCAEVVPTEPIPTEITGSKMFKVLVSLATF